MPGILMACSLVYAYLHNTLDEGNVHERVGALSLGNKLKGIR